MPGCLTLGKLRAKGDSIKTQSTPNNSKLCLSLVRQPLSLSHEPYNQVALLLEVLAHKRQAQKIPKSVSLKVFIMAASAFCIDSLAASMHQMFAVGKPGFRPGMSFSDHLGKATAMPL